MLAPTPSLNHIGPVSPFVWLSKLFSYWLFPQHSLTNCFILRDGKKENDAASQHTLWCRQMMTNNCNKDGTIMQQRTVKNWADPWPNFCSRLGILLGNCQSICLGRSTDSSLLESKICQPVEKAKRCAGQTLPDKGNRMFISKQYRSKVEGTEFLMFTKVIYPIGAQYFPFEGKESIGVRFTIGGVSLSG